MLTEAEKGFFVQEQALHEAKYQAGSNSRQQSGFGRDARDWQRFRRPNLEVFSMRVYQPHGPPLSAATATRAPVKRVPPNPMLQRSWPSLPLGPGR
jgi:hypothetical protein